MNPKKRRRLVIAIIIAVILLAGGWLSWQYTALKRSTAKIFANGQNISLTSLLNAQNVQLAGQSSDRTNIMVYGLTADGHRTDTMMLISYYWQENKIVTLNIPRDLWTSYKGYTGKIVSLYAVAQAAEPTNKAYPPQYVSDFITQEYNIPINYWIVANFNGLVQMVDSLGGIDVNNPTAFTDYLYPNANYTGYIRPAPSFAAGEIHLNGANALIYSRSRHSTAANEGTDFARSARQAQVIQAVLSKLKAQGTLTNAAKVNDYLSILGESIYTSLSPEELISFANTISKLNLSQDYLAANWSTASGFICGVVIDGQDALEYGVLGNCVGETGVDSKSPYRVQALDYIKNLLTNATPKPAVTTPPTSSSP